ASPAVEVLAKGEPDVPPPPVAPPPPSPVTPVVTVVQQVPTNSGLRTAGWVVGGVGAAGLVFGFVEYFVVANNQKNNLSSQQTNGVFPANYQSQFQSANNTVKTS